MMKFFAAFLVFVIAFAVASDAIIVYRSNTGVNGLNSPKIRFWNSSGVGSWGNEIELPSAGSPIRQAVVRYSPINQKVVIVTLSNDGYLDGYVCFVDCTNPNSWTVSNNIGRVWSTAGNQRRFDIQFESATGNLLLVYSVFDTDGTRDIGYKVLPNTAASFSSGEKYLDDNSTVSDIQYTWVALDRNPINTSNEILFVGFDATSSDVMGAVWKDGEWQSRIELTTDSTATGGGEAIAVAYAADGSKGMIAAGRGTVGNIAYSFWNGTSWSAIGTFDIDAGDANDVIWLKLKPDPASDSIMAVWLDNGADLGTAYWNGASFIVGPQHDNATDTSTGSRCADYIWGNDSRGVLVWDTDTTGATLSYRSWTAGVWSATTTISSYAGTGAWISLYANPTANDTVKALGIRLNANFNIGSFRWLGGTDSGNFTNYGNTAIATNATVSTFEAYGVDFIRAIDKVGPSITNVRVNSSSVLVNESICINATIEDKSGVIATATTITFPNGTKTEFPMNETGCNAGNDYDGVYGVSVNVGQTPGTLVVQSVTARDPFNNVGSEVIDIDVSVSPLIFVDTTISATTLSFGAHDPGTFKAAALENPIILTNTLNSNTPIDVYLNNTHMVSGANTIPCTNMSVKTTNNPSDADYFRCSVGYLNGTSANQGYIENLAVGSNVTLYFWHDVPFGQAAGSYTATVRIHSVADGYAP